MNKEVEAFKALLAANLGDRSGTRSIEEMRAGYESLGSTFPTGEDWQSEAVSADGVPCELSHTGDPGPQIVMYLHGGGYVIGSMVTHRPLVANIARAAGCRVLAVDYRLAPEHPFPAAVEDASKVYRWLLDQGYKPQEVVIAGDSAGGGLTVATMLKLRTDGVALPAAGICLSPWVDMEALGASMDEKSGEDPMVERQGLLGMASTYLNGADAKDPLAAPIYGDLTGLPPLLLQVGTAETLLDDARRLAVRAIECGVNVDYEEWRDMIHVFQHFAPMLSDGLRAIARIGAFVQRCTTSASGN